MSTSTQFLLFKKQKLTLTLETGRDLSAASTMTMLVRSPSGDTSQRSVTITNTTLGYIQSTFAINELDEAGKWQFKAYEADNEIRGKTEELYINDDWET